MPNQKKFAKRWWEGLRWSFRMCVTLKPSVDKNRKTDIQSLPLSMLKRTSVLKGGSGSCRLSNDERLATVFKERLQQFGGTACEDAAANFHFVIQLRVVQQLHYRIHCARFRIVRAVDQAVDPGVPQGSGAHRARFNRSKQVALREAMVTEDCSRLA